MTTWNEYVEAHGAAPEWPYPIRYDEVNDITADVLVVRRWRGRPSWRPVIT